MLAYEQSWSVATNHKIPVDFARSTARKINVQIDCPEWQTFLETNIKKVYGYPSGGAIRTDVLATVTITMFILIVITVAIMLSLNG